MVIDVLDDELHAMPLDLGGVGLLSATLDKEPAAIGRAADGQLNLLVSGLGQHKLAARYGGASLELNSAQQMVRFLTIPNAAAGKWHLTVPGDVEIKGGADVVSRELDKTARATRFELLPRGGDTTVLTSLNSHFERKEQAVAARCVLFDEVTEAYEGGCACHDDLLGPASRRRSLPLRRSRRFRDHPDRLAAVVALGCWPAKAAAKSSTCGSAKSRSSDTIVLNVSAIKTPAKLKQWQFPRLVNCSMSSASQPCWACSCRAI